MPAFEEIYFLKERPEKISSFPIAVSWSGYPGF